MVAELLGPVEQEVEVSRQSALRSREPPACFLSKNRRRVAIPLFI